VFERLDEIEQTYVDVERQLSDPEVLADQARLVELSKRHAELGEVVRAYRAWRAAREDLDTARQLQREERSAEGRALLDEETASRAWALAISSSSSARPSAERSSRWSWRAVSRSSRAARQAR